MQHSKARPQFKPGDVLLHPRSEAFYEIIKVVPGRGIYHLKKMMPHAHTVVRRIPETDGHFDLVREG